ncbi:unnamed protein product, partial [Pylaiella littoralis]
MDNFFCGRQERRRRLPAEMRRTTKMFSALRAQKSSKSAKHKKSVDDVQTPGMNPSTPPENTYFALPSHASNTSATSRALASVSGSSASPNSSRQNGVINIDIPRDDTDRFAQSYAAWPLDGHYNMVYVVSQQLRHDDPPLF